MEKQFDRLIEEMSETGVHLDGLMFCIIFRGTKSADSATAIKYLNLCQLRYGIELNNFHGVALERWTKPKWLKDLSVREWFHVRGMNYEGLPEAYPKEKLPEDHPERATQDIYRYIVCIANTNGVPNKNVVPGQVLNQQQRQDLAAERGDRLNHAGYVGPSETKSPRIIGFCPREVFSDD